MGLLFTAASPLAGRVKPRPLSVWPMNPVRSALQISRVFVAALLVGACQAATPSVVEYELFRPVLISPLGVSKDRLAILTKSEIDDVARARGVLGEFFRRLEKPSGNPLELLTPQYAHEKPSRLAPRTALVADETNVMEVGLTDFKFLKPESLELRFYALIMAEGTLAVGEGKAELSKLSGSWKIALVQVGGK